MILQSFGNDVEFATVQVICRAPTAMSDASPLLNAETVLSLAHRQPTKFEYLVVNIQSTVVSFSRNSISYDDEPTLNTTEQDSESTKICRQWFDHNKALQRHLRELSTTARSYCLVLFLTFFILPRTSAESSQRT